MIDLLVGGGHNLQPEYYSLLIVNAQNERGGNCTTTKGRGSEIVELEFSTTKWWTEMYSTCVGRNRICMRACGIMMLAKRDK